MEKEQTNQLFAFLVMVSRKDGTIFVDYTGTFPIRAIDGMAAIFVLYDWTTNAILATPVKDVKEGSTISAFKNNVEYLSKRGFRPTSTSWTILHQKQSGLTSKAKTSTSN